MGPGPGVPHTPVGAFPQDCCWVSPLPFLRERPPLCRSRVKSLPQFAIIGPRTDTLPGRGSAGVQPILFSRVPSLLGKHPHAPTLRGGGASGVVGHMFFSFYFFIVFFKVAQAPGRGGGSGLSDVTILSNVSLTFLIFDFMCGWVCRQVFVCMSPDVLQVMCVGVGASVWGGALKPGRSLPFGFPRVSF